jgi:RNA polymerase sigma factor (sigma-70 family)
MSEPAPLSVLVRLAAAGDEAAWSALVTRFAPLLWSVCRRHRLSAADAEDVIAEVWLRLLARLPSLREPDALPGWLATTTRHECLRRLMKTSRRAERELPLLPDVVAEDRGDQIDDHLLRAERSDVLRSAFATLGERCRRLIGAMLRDPTPSYAEIGAELDMPIGSIGPTKQRCLEVLRRSPAIAALRLVERPSPS